MQIRANIDFVLPGKLNRKNAWHGVASRIFANRQDSSEHFPICLPHKILSHELQTFTQPISTTQPLDTYIIVELSSHTVSNLSCISVILVRWLCRSGSAQLLTIYLFLAEQHRYGPVDEKARRGQAAQCHC